MNFTPILDPNRAVDSVSLSVSSGARLVSPEGAALPLRGTHLRASAQGGIARVTLTQSFINRGTEPLRVTYLLPLPENAAVSGYEFVLDGVRTVGEVKAREDARQAFEEALIEGRSAALLEEERSTLFRQEIGNVPPGAEISIEVKVDQKLSWRAGEGAWEWRFPTVVAPRFQGEDGQVTDAVKNQVPVADLPNGRHLPARASLELTLGDALSGAPSSPSHGIAAGPEGNVSTLISFGDERGEGGPGVALDRDIVVRWPVAANTPGVSLSVDGGNKSQSFGLLTIVPPTAGTGLSVPRDLIVLLDTSGSMGGEPLRQAVAVISDLVDSLGERDQLEIIEFSQKARRWNRRPVKATASNRKKAKDWLGSLQASGGTYMRDGILEALAPLGVESQRQVLLVTDGMIGFENEIIEEIAHRLPAACRVHTLGIGHGVNRSLTGPVARAGRGVEQIVAPGEDVAAATAELLAMTQDPALVNLQVTGNVELAARIPDVLAGSPAIIPIRLADGMSAIELTLTGHTASGVWSRTIELERKNADPGSGANAQLFAREKVQDLELAGAAGEDGTAIDAKIERVGIDFQIATRRTSWVAVSEALTVDPTDPTRTVTMPHELAAGLSAEGVGLRSVAGGALQSAAPQSMAKAASRSGVPDKLRRVRAPRAHITLDGTADANENFGGAPLPKKKEAAMPPREGGSGDDLEAEASEQAPVSIELDGEILLWKEGRLVMAFQAEGPLSWQLPEDVTLVLADGTERTVKVLREGSTATRSVHDGQVIRMTFIGVPESIEISIRSVRIACGPQGPLTVHLTK